MATLRSAIVPITALMLAACAANRDQASSGTSASQAPPAPTIRVSGDPNTIPPGTRLEVRTNDAISSKAGDGKTYNAQIETDIVGGDGKLLIPKGSPVELVVMETREKSGVRGAGLRLGMRSVTVGNRTYLVISEELDRTTGLGANRRTAEMVGGGAALGTVIGAASGGGRGAVIGGLAGAAAGALAQILTQGNEVRIPAETVLQFRVDEPIVLQPAATP
jgi:outer membrane lipoprotein SlyB